MRQCRIRDKWQEFVNLPVKQQTWEQIATFVAQWCQPCKHILYSNIVKTLDEIAQQVLQFLKEQHPRHRIYSTPVQKLSFWKDNIDDNQWNAKESRQIINAICMVIFKKLKFQVKMRDTLNQYECFEHSLWVFPEVGLPIRTYIDDVSL